jgi:TolA-binding protein
MKDEHDLLARVSRTLRERHDGKEERSTMTRERILASVRQQNKRKSWWVKGSIPGGILLVGTTAWAQATHQWPAVWRTIGDIFSLPLSGEGSGEQALAKGTYTHHTNASRAYAPTETVSTTLDDAGAISEATLAVSDANVALGTSSSLDELAHPDEAKTAKVSTKHRKRTAPFDEPSAQTQPPLNDATLVSDVDVRKPPAEPEIAAFRAANDLDIKQRNLGAALSAYRLYLRDYPNGRFVPEARYNVAIILVKLGKRDEARQALTPFASGKYGAHRQQRAAKLLQALERE